MPRALRQASIAGCVIYLLAAIWMGRLEQAGPAAADLILPGGTPATLTLPAPDAGRDAFLAVPPRDARPPAVVLMHGFASDRRGLSTLARRLAAAGYAVLSFDASGHGQSRRPFPRSMARPDAFFEEMAAAVDFLRGDPRVDGERIAVMGHSMGAGAALDFATRDQGLDAVVAISGGWTIFGPFRPPDALFVFASGDPPRIAQRARELVATLAGVDAIEMGRHYGDPRQRTAVRAVEIPGADHLTILWSAPAALQIVRWLDAAFGRPPTPAVVGDPRLAAAALMFLALLLVLPGIGEAVGRLASRRPAREGPGALAGLLALAAALLLVMPLLAVDVPLAFLSVEVGDVVASQLSLAGVALLAWLRLRGALEPTLLRAAPLRSAFAAAVGVVAFTTLLLPIGAVVHRLAPTPERVAVWVGLTLALLPFSLAFQWLLRGGSARRAALLGAAGRLLVLGVLSLGVATGLLSFVVILMLPALVLVFVLVELLIASVYAVSRDLAAITWIDAACIAWVIAMAMPIRL